MLVLAVPEREVASLLASLDVRLASPRPVADKEWRDAERIAKLHVLPFYYEIRRLEQVVLYGRFG